MKIIEVFSKEELEDLLCTTTDFEKATYEPYKIPKWESSVVNSIGTNKLFHLSGEDFNELHKKLLHQIYVFGSLVPSQYGDTKELLNVTFQADIPKKFDRYEDWWEKYTEDLIDHSNTGDGKYSYGQLIGMALSEKIGPLDDLSRGYYIDVYGAWEKYFASELTAPPCLTSIQILNRNNEVTCICNWRSNDAYKALPVNYFSLYRYVSELYNDTPIKLIFNIASSHVYAQDWKHLPIECPIKNKKVTDSSLEKKDHRSTIVFESKDVIQILDYEGNILTKIDISELENYHEIADSYITNYEHYDYFRKEIQKLNGKDV